MTENTGYVVTPVEPCSTCEGVGRFEVKVVGVGSYDEDCVTCDGRGWWAVLEQAQRVEPGGTQTKYGKDTREDDRFVINEVLATRRLWVEPWVPVDTEEP